MARAVTICKDHTNLTNMLIIDFIAQVIDVTIKIWEEDRMRDKNVLHMSSLLIFIWLHYDYMQPHQFNQYSFTLYVVEAFPNQIRESLISLTKDFIYLITLFHM